MREYKVSVRAHGRHQLEIKNNYPLSDKRKVQYLLNVYFFIPGQLNITSETYGVKAFYQDIKANTRFGIANLPISKIIDPNCPVSPLTRIRNYLNELTINDDTLEKLIHYELRVLANFYGAELKATFRLIRKLKGGEKISEIVETKLNILFQEIERFLTDFRSLHHRFIDPHISDDLRTALQWADEAISLHTKRLLFNFLELFSRSRVYGNSQQLQNHMILLIRHEASHRKAMNYESIYDENIPNSVERIIYRESILKKWCQKVLYMSSEESAITKNIGHVIASVAAAAAMAVAVIAAFFAERLFAIYSMPWVFLIVGSYILKDRIKEILRGFLVHFMPRGIADKVKILNDPAAKKKVGRTKSMVNFFPAGKADPAVLKVRNTGKNPFHAILPEENIVHFRKEIRLAGRKLLDKHTRLEAVTEIIRFKMDRFFREMDSPEKRFRTLLEEGNIKVLEGKRTYHINVLVGLSTIGETEPRYFRYRLVLSRNGIERIEPIRLEYRR